MTTLSSASRSTPGAPTTPPNLLEWRAADLGVATGASAGF